MTKEAILNRSKTVTRRLGWKRVKVGDLLQGCEKVMGRRNGEPLVKLAVVRVVSVKREKLVDILDYKDDCTKEGFPSLYCSEFINMFCEAMKCDPQTEVTRIEFEYV